MTLRTMCALAPLMCRMGADAQVHRAVAALSAGMDAPPAAWAGLLGALRRHGQDASAMMTLLGGRMTQDDLRQCFDREALAFFHVCGQCRAGEVLAVLTRCSVPPTAEGLALLLGERRREVAMARYGLQLLWRFGADETLPDALSVFPEDAPARSAGEIVSGLVRQLKGGDLHG